MRIPALRGRLPFALASAAIPLVVFLPGLGAHGFWEPAELAVVAGEVDRVDAYTRLLLSVGGSTTFLSRLPFALSAVAAVALLQIAVTRWTDRWTGLLAAAVAVSMPRVVFDAGLIDLGAGALVAGAAIVAGASLAWTGARAVGIVVAIVGLGVAVAADAVVSSAAPALVAIGAAGWVGRRPRVVIAAAAGLIGSGLAFHLAAPEVDPVEPVRWAQWIEPVVHGAFPWVAAVPVAAGVVGRLDDPHVRVRATLGLTWATSAVALPLLATASVTAVEAECALPMSFLLGVTLLPVRIRRAALPAAGAFVAVVVVVLAFDVERHPTVLTRLAHLSHPADAWEPMARTLQVLGLLFAVVAGVALGRGSRRALHGAVALALASGAFVAWVWLPQVGSLVSSRPLFDAFERHRRDADVLLVHGMDGPGPRLYAGEAQRAATRPELLSALSAPGRSFAIGPRSMLCDLHQAERSQPLSVLAETAEHFLFAADAGEVPDRSPLRGVLSRRPPVDVGEPMSVRLAEVEILGVELPRRLARGEEAQATIHLRVLAPPRRQWRVFVHFDGPGHRFQGDHHPIDGLCPTQRWRAGDYVADTFSFEAGTLFSPPGTYRVYAGFYVGSAGAWTNMEVIDGPADGDDRVLLGLVELL